MMEKGTKVRIKECSLDGFLVAFQKKVRGRVGVVTGHFSFRPGSSLVEFPAVGRKKELKMCLIGNAHLELVDIKDPS